MENKICIEFYPLLSVLPVYLCKRDFIKWSKSNVYSVSKLVFDGKISLKVRGYFCNFVFVDDHVFLRAIGDENGSSFGVNIKIK